MHSGGLIPSELHALTQTLKAASGDGPLAPVSAHGAEDFSCQRWALHYEATHHHL